MKWFNDSGHYWIGILNIYYLTFVNSKSVGGSDDTHHGNAQQGAQMRLTNKKIVITGGTSGIGKKLVDILAADNQLIVIGRDESKLKILSREHPNITTYIFDLADLGGVKKGADQISRDHPVIDVLINNAAVQFTPKFMDDDFQLERIKYEIDVNFTSICYLVYLLLPALSSESRRSIILNLNTALAFVPKKNSAIYCATKGAINILSQSLRYQFENTNIRVLQAFLPIVDTEMTVGRGTGKMSSDKAASSILQGIEDEVDDNYIGKVKLLRIIYYIVPSLARSILKKY